VENGSGKGTVPLPVVLRASTTAVLDLLDLAVSAQRVQGRQLYWSGGFQKALRATCHVLVRLLRFPAIRAEMMPFSATVHGRSSGMELPPLLNV
jgi:hypothetical protein